MKLSDFTTERLVEYIAELEKKKVTYLREITQIEPAGQNERDLNRPKVIWELFKEHFGEEFFLDCIEEDFGISPGSDELLARQIVKHFNVDLTAYKVEMQKVQVHYEKQVE